MNRSLNWKGIDWSRTDKEIAASVGCKVATVRKRRKEQEGPGGGKKGIFTRKGPQLTLRLEEELYDSLEFLGVLAGGFGKPEYVSDVIRSLLVREVGRLKQTYPEERNNLKLFRNSETAKEAVKVADEIDRQAEKLEDSFLLEGNEMSWGMDVEERLKESGLDRKHRDAYRKLARIKRTSNLTPYVFRLQAAPAKGYGRIGVAVYAPAKGWDARCELAFEAEGEQGKPLALGVDIAEAEKDLLRGLPKEASPRELFDGLFGDEEVLAALRPRIEDKRIKEKDCNEDAYRRFLRSEGAGR